MSSSMQSMKCSARIQLAEQPIFIISLVVRAILSLIGIVAILLVAKREIKLRRFHPNARILLFTHYSFVWISAAAVFSSAIVHLYFFDVRPAIFSQLFQPDKCPIPFGYNHIFIRWISIFGNNGSITTFAGMAIERCRSTIYSRHYEKKGYFWGIFAGGICVFGAACSIYTLYFPQLSGRLSATIVLFTLAGVELIAILIFVFLYFCNVVWKKSKHHFLASLSQKYQVEENVRCIQLLIPLASAHAACNLSTCILLPISWIIFDEKKPVPNTYFDFIPLYYLLLPIVFFGAIRKRTKVKQTKARLNETSAKRNHFEILGQIFENARNTNENNKHINENNKRIFTYPMKR